MRELPPLQKFADAFAGGAADDELEAMLPGLLEGKCLEEAMRMLRSPHSKRANLLRVFETAATRARAARQSSWQFDAHKVRLRMRYRRTGASAAILPGEFLARLAEWFRQCGLAVAPTMEKRPRPMIHLGPPLPLGTEGLGEWLEVVLTAPPAESDLLPVLHRFAPEGLEFLEAKVLPDYASPVLDLAVRAAWLWPCPATLRMEAESRVAAFLASGSYHIEKTGKEGGAKQMKKIEVRPLVLEMAWHGEDLLFSTRLVPGQALHPAKLLGGILGTEPASIRGLVRTSIELASDPRLDQAERFEPKLKNMFEDAVLLKAGSNLKLVEEDDDEPLQLG